MTAPWAWFALWWAALAAVAVGLACHHGAPLARLPWYPAVVMFFVSLWLAGLLIAAIADDRRVLAFIVAMVFCCTASRLDQLVRRTVGK